ncbi:MAG: Trm112 family protein [Candidatus Puniceispirillaceae bacterium]
MTRDTDNAGTGPGTGLDPALLEVLVCPVTHGPLEYDRVRNELVSHQLGRAFPVRGGVPVMLLDEARELSDEERAERG